MKTIRERPILGYGLAVGSAALAFYVRLVLQPVLPPGFPYLTFFPAVILTAFVAGLWPGILCAVLSGFAAWWFFIPPVGLAINPPTALALVFYVFIVGVDITIIEMMRRAMARLSAEQGLTAQLYERQRVMFQELQHRVANNMAFVAALLQLKKRAIAHPEAHQALDEARERLANMAQIHRRLYDPAALDQGLEASLQALCDEMVAAAGAPQVRCVVAAEDIGLETPQVVTLSLLIAEAVTNAIKHAFADRPDGEICVSLRRSGAMGAELVIADDGPGFPAAGGAAGSRSLGFSIMHSLAGQLGGSLDFPPGAGATIRLSFPAGAPSSQP
jgi:two-component sensor histidine kinase